MAVWSTQFEHALRSHSNFASGNTTIDPDVSLPKLGIDSLETPLVPGSELAQ